MQAGDKVSFGSYNWRGLDIQNNTALMITECIIEQRASHDAYQEIIWADCSVTAVQNRKIEEKIKDIGLKEAVLRKYDTLLSNLSCYHDKKLSRRS